MKTLIVAAVLLVFIGGFFTLRRAERQGEPLIPAPVATTTTPTPSPTLAPTSSVLKKENVDAAFAYSRSHKGDADLILDKQGNVLAEDYENGFKKDDPHVLASGTKSFSGVMLAALIEDGLVPSYDAKVSDVITEWKSDPAKVNITLRQLLTLSSGLDPGQNGAAPRYAAAIGYPVTAPGTFQYGPVPFEVFGEYVKRVVAPKGYADASDYVQRRVLTPAGVTLARWGMLGPNEPNMAGGVALTAREWADFGLFLLNNGFANGKQIVPSGLLAELHKPSAGNAGYGITFWLTTDATAGMVGGAISPNAMIPSGGYAAAGAGNQRLFILPQHDLVVVRFGEAGPWDDGEFLDLLLGK